ncbi:Cupin 2 conserved barrel domain protein [Beutenbergia cavernae DSM 12333]|uniref:Cupin 2 conserved barrel domain protein n=1 Tax=Beutenbergia cavernae (strain ATCC BAA-8 / DSM 12333 / CCUG 43141 / JCM 11478 / NBRC 16432 / NCIMB 13614 / HKI 0122) TaxID=471853 RepID=C5BW88_BEUC1|nr:cupin domain-containing protein [Beutenbergia cavernae]ACQ78546.1 Cupin 2 conserved barrel domain protein [Beutenbergia cavernae DSM 12333]
MTTYLLGPTSAATIVSRSATALEAEVRYAPRSRPPPVHLFPTQSGHVEVLEGELSARLGRTTRTYRAGESFDVPAGTRHTMWNASPEPTRTTWRTAPPGRSAEWLASLDAAVRAGGGVAAVALVTREFRDVLRLAGVPGVVLPLLAVVGRLRARFGVDRGR